MAIDKIISAPSGLDQIRKINEIIDAVNEGGSGGTLRNVGEIVQSTVPLNDSGLHLADGSMILGDGIYADFVGYMANLFEDCITRYYYWGYAGGTGEVYTLSETPSANDQVFSYDATTKTASVIEGASVTSYDSSNNSIVVGSTTYTRDSSNDVIVYNEAFCSEQEWQDSVVTYGACGKFVYDSVNDTVRLPMFMSPDHGALIYFEKGTDIWCRVYEDGWCEQSGIVSVARSSTKTVNLLKAFSSTDYYLIGSWMRSGNIDDNIMAYRNNASSIKVYCSDIGSNDSFGSGNACWNAQGYTDISAYQKKGNYQYIVVANSTKTEIEVDIDEIATELNMVSNHYKYDGGIVVSYLEAYNNTLDNGSSTNINLSSYLPNDGYDYFIAMSCGCVTGTTSSNSCVCVIYSDLLPTEGYIVSGTRTRSASNVLDYAGVEIPVGSERKITISNKGGASGTIIVRFEYYRRIGTNT